MKKLQTSSVPNGVTFQIKKGTFEFLQDSHKETTQALLSNLIDNPLTDTVYILSGCVNSGSGSNYIISSGYVYYNGEVYTVDATTFTVASGEYAFADIITTKFTTYADPVHCSDGTDRNIHNIRKIQLISSTGTGYPLFSDFILVNTNSWLLGDTKDVVCDSTYLSDNFEISGLGKNERLGWAIMNGNNGTPNDNGKVIIAYGADYTTLEATGGSKDAIVVSHTHTVSPTETPTYGASGAVRNTWGASAGDSGAAGTTTPLVTSSAGSSGTNANMMPYRVRLRIMKL